MGAGSLRGSVLALASTAFGSGVLALPWVFASTGLLLGGALLAAGALAAFASLRLLANAAYATGVQDYSKVVRRALGPRSAVALDIVVLLYCGGSVCGYFVFIEQFGPLLMQSLGLAGWLERPMNLVLLLTAFPVLPLSLTRKLSSLRYASLVSTAGLVVVALMIVAQTPDKYAEVAMTADVFQLLVPPPGSWAVVPRAASIFFFAYCCHINAFAAYAGMENPAPHRVDKVISRALCLMVVVYSTVGACGFVSYGPACAVEVPNVAWPSCTPTNILASPRFNGPVSVVSRLCMTGVLSVTIPLSVHAARAIVEGWILGVGEVAPWPRERAQSSLYTHISITVLMLASALTLAILYRNVNSILGVVGGFAAVSFMFSIPVAIMLALHLRPPPKGLNTEGLQIGHWLGVTRSGVILVAVFLSVCVAMGYFSACVAVRDIIASAM